MFLTLFSWYFYCVIVMKMILSNCHYVIVFYFLFVFPIFFHIFKSYIYNCLLFCISSPQNLRIIKVSQKSKNAIQDFKSETSTFLVLFCLGVICGSARGLLLPPSCLGINPGGTLGTIWAIWGQSRIKQVLPACLVHCPWSQYYLKL